MFNDFALTLICSRGPTRPTLQGVESLPFLELLLIFNRHFTQPGVQNLPLSASNGFLAFRINNNN